MESQDIASVINTLVTNGLINETHVFIVLFVAILFALRKLLYPIKTFYDKLAKNETQEEMKTNIKNIDDALDENFKDLESTFEKISFNLDELQKKVETNHKDIQALRNDISFIKTCIDKIYLNFK